MSRIASFVAPGAKLACMYLERLLAGVTAENHARFPSPGGTTIQTNHPAFILGHLSLYPARALQALGQSAETATPPASYEELFQNGVECRDDPSGHIYPPLEELKKRCFDAHAAAIAGLESAPDTAFDAPNPAEGRLREMFPTVGAAVNFYLVGHTQVHLGQFSTWRRAMGLPAA